MSELGHSRRFCYVRAESAFTPNSGAIADIVALRLRPQKRTSSHFDVCRPNELCPCHELGLDDLSKLLWRARDWIIAERGQALHHVWLRNGNHDLPMKRGNDVF